MLRGKNLCGIEDWAQSFVIAHDDSAPYNRTRAPVPRDVNEIAPKPSAVPGGWREATVNSTVVAAAMRTATAALQNSAVLVRAETQVVAGLNARLLLRSADSANTEQHWLVHMHRPLLSADALRTATAPAEFRVVSMKAVNNTA